MKIKKNVSFNTNYELELLPEFESIKVTGLIDRCLVSEQTGINEAQKDNSFSSPKWNQGLK